MGSQQICKMLQHLRHFLHFSILVAQSGMIKNVKIKNNEIFNCTLRSSNALLNLKRSSASSINLGAVPKTRKFKPVKLESKERAILFAA